MLTPWPTDMQSYSGDTQEIFRVYILLPKTELPGMVTLDGPSRLFPVFFILFFFLQEELKLQ